jgi:plasmid stabilization system protein ParE
MSEKPRLTSAANRDLASIFVYFLDHDAVSAASGFESSFEATLQFIAMYPDLGSPTESKLPRLKNVRCKPVQDFEDYLIYYRNTSSGSLILRVLHGSQDTESNL